MVVRKGILGIPCPERIAFNPTVYPDIRPLYSEIYDSEYGQALYKRLQNDSRVTQRLSQDHFMGMTYQRITLEDLTFWHLWRTNNHGVETADTELEAFLEQDCTTVLATVWVTGVAIQKPVDLFDGIRAFPLEYMPETFDKYLLHGPSMRASGMGMFPSVAITKAISVSVMESAEEADARRERKTVSAELEKLMFACELLPLLHGCCAAPESSAVYVPDYVPCGVFYNNGISGNPWHEDGRTDCIFTFESSSEISAIQKCYEAARQSQDLGKLRLVLRRIAQSKRRAAIEDRILDLAIALEMLLLKKGEKGELTYRLALRGACFVSSDQAERRRSYEALKTLYRLRSYVVHTGEFRKGKDYDDAYNQIESFEELTETICTKVLLEGWPTDWDTLILGA